MFVLGDDGMPHCTSLTFTAPVGKGEITAGVVRAYPLSLALGHAANHFAYGKDDLRRRRGFTIRRPGRDPDAEWWETFARLYMLARRETTTPAALIAEQSDVPVSAVHRWSREARRRGLLPPDPRGRRTTPKGRRTK